MPVFYLHIHDHSRVMADGEGTVFPSEVEARNEAFRILEELVSDGVWQPNSAGCFIRIVDRDGQDVATVYLWELGAQRSKD